MNKFNIKKLVKDVAWQDVKQVFIDEILESKKSINFKCEGKTDAIIASECRAREIASSLVDKCLKKLDRIANERDVDKENWK